MKKSTLALLSTLLLTWTFTVSAAGGQKNLNPVTSVEIGDECVYVFVGSDSTVCEDATSPDQSQQAYMCEVLKLCPKATTTK